MYQQGTKSKCKVIALANQKRGTAKTTTTVNLGIGLAKAYTEFTREMVEGGEKQRNQHESSLSR